MSKDPVDHHQKLISKMKEIHSEKASIDSKVGLAKVPIRLSQLKLITNLTMLNLRGRA